MYYTTLIRFYVSKLWQTVLTLHQNSSFHHLYAEPNDSISYMKTTRLLEKEAISLIMWHNFFQYATTDLTHIIFDWPFITLPTKRLLSLIANYLEKGKPWTSRILFLRKMSGLCSIRYSRIKSAFKLESDHILSYHLNPSNPLFIFF